MGGLFAFWCNTQMTKGKSIDAYAFMPHETKPKPKMQPNIGFFERMYAKAKANSLKKEPK